MFLQGGITTYSIEPHIYTDVPYDATKDFARIVLPGKLLREVVGARTSLASKECKRTFSEVRECPLFWRRQTATDRFQPAAPATTFSVPVLIATSEPFRASRRTPRRQRTFRGTERSGATSRYRSSSR